MRISSSVEERPTSCQRRDARKIQKQRKRQTLPSLSNSIQRLQIILSHQISISTVHNPSFPPNINLVPSALAWPLSISLNSHKFASHFISFFFFSFSLTSLVRRESYYYDNKAKIHIVSDSHFHFPTLRAPSQHTENKYYGKPKQKKKEKKKPNKIPILFFSLSLSLFSFVEFLSFHLQKMKQKSPIMSAPPWLEPLLKTAFFSICHTHGDAARSERNMYCLDCHCDAFCFYCRSSHHKDHQVIQVRQILKFLKVFGNFEKWVLWSIDLGEMGWCLNLEIGFR